MDPKENSDHLVLKDRPVPINVARLDHRDP